MKSPFRALLNGRSLRYWAGYVVFPFLIRDLASLTPTAITKLTIQCLLLVGLVQIEAYDRWYSDWGVEELIFDPQSMRRHFPGNLLRPDWLPTAIPKLQVRHVREPEGEEKDSYTCCE